MSILAISPDSVRPNVATPPATWQEVLRKSVRDADELCQLLGLSPEFAQAAKRSLNGFPLFVPRGYLSRIEVGNPHDPLLRQVLPVPQENEAPPGFTTDPVGDHAAELSPGLLHKYAGRVLLVTTGACGVHCRYCFRRHFPYSAAPHSPAAWEPALAQIAADPTIEEVLLSGGDPLMLVDSHLAELTRRLAEIPHLRRLRIHTRMPIVIPERVTDALLAWLCGSRLRPIVVVHANHANEIDGEVAIALGRLRDAGVPLLNQSVLLRGVNDNAEALIALSKRLIDLGVMPYYLHQLDRVTGAAHFEVPREWGLELIEAMRLALPGYAVPRYVQEVAGEGSKTAVE